MPLTCDAEAVLSQTFLAHSIAFRDLPGPRGFHECEPGRLKRLPYAGLRDRRRGDQFARIQTGKCCIDQLFGGQIGIFGKYAFADAGGRTEFGADRTRLRSEERSVGKECGSTFRSRWAPDN